MLRKKGVSPWAFRSDALSMRVCHFRSREAAGRPVGISDEVRRLPLVSFPHRARPPPSSPIPHGPRGIGMMRDLDPKKCPSSPGPLSVLIVDDVSSTRRYLRTVLEYSPQFDVAGEAHDGDVAIEKAELLQPDLVLLDLSMPRLNGASALSGIVGATPGAKVIIFSVVGPEVGSALLDAGASAFVPKEFRHLTCSED